MSGGHNSATAAKKYQHKHAQTLVAAATSLVSVLVGIAPFVGAVAPLAVAGKYAWDKIEEHSERRDASRSLMGVLAKAKTGYTA